MSRSTVRRIFAAGAAAVLVVTAVVIWQFPALARIVAGVIASNALHANVTFARVSLTTQSVVLEDARVLSIRGEPLATIDRVAIIYGLRDLLPGSKRLFGLRSVTVYAPRLTIVRHRDGTYNVPIPQLPAPSGRQGTPLVARGARRRRLDLGRGRAPPRRIKLATLRTQHQRGCRRFHRCPLDLQRRFRLRRGRRPALFRCEGAAKSTRRPAPWISTGRRPRCPSPGRSTLSSILPR